MYSLYKGEKRPTGSTQSNIVKRKGRGQKMKKGSKEAEEKKKQRKIEKLKNSKETKTKKVCEYLHSFQGVATKANYLLLLQPSFLFNRGRLSV